MPPAAKGTSSFGILYSFAPAAGLYGSGRFYVERIEGQERVMSRSRGVARMMRAATKHTGNATANTNRNFGMAGKA